MITEDTEKIYLVGDVRYTDSASVMYVGGNGRAQVDFMMALQELMEEYGVIKIDVSTDAFRYLKIKNEEP